MIIAARAVPANERSVSGEIPRLLLDAIDHNDASRLLRWLNEKVGG